MQDLPPVLQLQLKRFDYDYHKDTMVKVCRASGYCSHSCGSFFRLDSQLLLSASAAVWIIYFYHSLFQLHPGASVPSALISCLLSLQVHGSVVWGDLAFINCGNTVAAFVSRAPVAPFKRAITKAVRKLPSVHTHVQKTPTLAGQHSAAIPREDLKTQPSAAAVVSHDSSSCGLLLQILKMYGSAVLPSQWGVFCKCVWTDCSSGTYVG